ncbi:MAG: ribbon-helix-helix protein, CopG family [Janthinobacterium lividum]
MYPLYISLRHGKKAIREHQLNIKANDDEKKLLEKVAKARGLNTSALVRMLVTDEARRLGIS